MSEESDSSDEDLDGIEATSEEGRILQARREEVGGGGRGATGALAPPPSLTCHIGSLFCFCVALCF